MKVVILAGGKGTRLSEETNVLPKPLVEIGGYPIIWHIMKHFSHYGHTEFVICTGYLGSKFKDYFCNFLYSQSDITINLATRSIDYHSDVSEPWQITILDTGAETQTGGRLKRARKFLNDEDFFFTYGDGVSNINLDKLVSHHRSSGKLATVTAARPVGRFGSLKIDNKNQVVEFSEKTEGERSWINAGFFVLKQQAIDYIDGDDTSWEESPLPRIAANNELSAYKHHGFWQAMDTLRDKNYLNKLWTENSAQWKVW